MTTTHDPTDPHGLDLEFSRLTDDQALARLDDLIEVLSPELVPGDPSDFDLDSDELISHAAAVDFALGTITEIADHAPSDGRRLSALNVLGRILGPEHIRNRLIRLANTTKSDATRLSAVYVLSRGLGIVGPIAPRNPEEPRIEVINIWPASAHELEEIRQRDAQIEPQGATPAERPTAARPNPHPTPRDPLPRLPTPTIPRLKPPSPIDHNPRSQPPTPNPHEPAPSLDPPTSPPSTSPPRRPRHIDALPSIITAGPVTIVNEPP